MGGCRCSFRTCENSSTTKPGYHFFHFPIRDEERCRKWAEYASKIQYIDLPANILRNKVVCADHFTDNCFMNSNKDRLTKLAVPTLLPLPTGDILDFSQSSDFYDAESNDKNKISANISVQNICKTMAGNTTTEPEIFYLEQGSDENGSIEQADSLLFDMADESIEFTKMVASQTNILNGNRKRTAKVDYGGCSDNEQNTIMMVETKPAGSSSQTAAIRQLGNMKDLKLRKVSMPKKKKLKSSPVSSTTVRKSIRSAPLDLLPAEEHFDESDGQPLYKSAALTETVRSEAIDWERASRAGIDELHSVLTADRLSKIDSISNEREEFQRIEKCVKEVESKLGGRLNEFQNKCLAQLGRIERVQSRPITVNAPAVPAPVATPLAAVAKIEVGAAMSKSHLFNGIKKYLNPSMVALLRMEMFGCSERPYKVDEKNFAMELHDLNATNAYEYMRDEWRFRLPPKKDVEQWIKDRDEAGSNSIDWDDC